MELRFFEDERASNFHPLTLTRPVDDLRIGILTIAEKWETVLGLEISGRIGKPELEILFPASTAVGEETCTWINSRYLPTASLINQINNLNEGTCIQDGNNIIAAKVDGNTSKNWIASNKPDFSSLLVIEAGARRSVSYLWDLFQLNSTEIPADLKRLEYPSSDNAAVSSQAILQNQSAIYISDGATIEPGAILIADEGPVYVGKDTTVMAGAMIKGPVAICNNSTVNMGAKIYPGTTIGPVCKVGGEINNSIFHSYSNKGHDGFVGNSLIGQWCNLGADTNTSNLKNNYSTIRITDWESRKEVETGQQFLGTVMGDHTKTAINTQLNTGTMCGVSCNIFAGDFPPKFISSFSWVGSNVIQPYKLDKAFEAMQAMMARRNVKLTDEYKLVMKAIFEREHR